MFVLGLSKADPTQLPTRIEHGIQWVWTKIFNLFN